LPCRNHGYPVKHTLEECELIKRYFKGDYKATSMDAPSGSAGNGEKGDTYPDTKRCLMIFGGPVVNESKHWQKLMAREVNAVALSEAVLAFLKRITLTTFHNRGASHLSSNLSCVLMDSKSRLNLPYAETYNAMGLS
jgi:hypothetical protein